MRGIAGASAARVLVAAFLLASPAVPAAHAANNPPPSILDVSDVTGDGVADVLIGQVADTPSLAVELTMVDGARGTTIWRGTVTGFLRAERVTLGRGAGYAIAARTKSSVPDLRDSALRMLVVDGSGRLRWDKTFAGRYVVPDLEPTYLLYSYAGVLARRGGADTLLLQSDAHVEAAADRVTRTTAVQVDTATGEVAVEHGPFDTTEQDVRLTPMPDVTGDGRADVALLTSSHDDSPGTGSLRAIDAATGAVRWTAAVRTSRVTQVRALGADRSGRPLVSVATPYYQGDEGLQVLDARTGTAVISRAHGNDATLADVRGTGGDGILVAYFHDYGKPNGYEVERVDLAGKVVRHAAFPVGRASTFGTGFAYLYGAGDLDADGVTDLVSHVAYAVPGHGTDRDDRWISGRTLASAAIARDIEPLMWTGPGTAAVDGIGDDLYALAGRTAHLIDGRTRRRLLDVTARDEVSAILATRDMHACADVLVLTWSDSGIALSRVAPNGTLVWSTRRGAVTARPLSTPRLACMGDPKKHP